MSLLREILEFCDERGMRHSKFGWDAAHDASLIHDMLNGRVVGPAVEQKVRDFMAGAPAVGGLMRGHGSNLEAQRERVEARQQDLHEAMHRIPPDRTPCFNCQVRRDVHDEHGCRRWRAAR